MKPTAYCRLLVTCLLHITVFGASPPDNRGNEFILMFMENDKYGSVTFPLELYVTTQETTPVTVHVTSPGSTSPHVDETFTVSDGQVHKVIIDGAFRMSGSGIDTKGILITANAEVACYGANKESLSNDVFLGLPVDALGTDYFAVCQNPPLLKCELGIASTQDNTQVKVTLPATGGDVTFKGVTYHAGDTITVSLAKFETLQLQTSGDISGAHIESTNPVAAFSGNIKTNIGQGNTSDHLVEQLTPSDRWGQKFVTASIPYRTVGDVFKVLAKEDNTHVTVPGMPPITLNKGEVREFELPSNQYTSLTSDKPVMLVQFVKSQQSGNEPADPSMMIVPPFEQFGSDYTFSTPEYSRQDYGNSSIYRYQNEFMIVADKSDIGGLLLDGKPFPATTWHDIPGSNLVGSFITLTKGAHTVRHSDPLSTFGGYLYGHAFRESYGFPTGMRLAPIYGNCTVTQGTPGDGIDNDCDNRIDEELCTPDNLNKDDDGDGKHDEDCVKPKPIDGLWGNWGPWGTACSVTCGDGMRTRTRACDSPKPKFGGLNCTGIDNEEKACYAGQLCPVDVVALCAANSRAIVPNPLNCAQYFDCSRTSPLGQLHLFECPYPDLFDNATLRCADFNTVTCDRRREPMAPCEYLQNQCSPGNVTCVPCDQRHHSCVGDPDGTQPVNVLMPEYKECKQNRTLSEGKCDIGYFNPQAHRCIPHNIGTLSFYCRAHPTELTATPLDCAKYYNCSKAGTTLGAKTDECEYPDLFSTVTGHCENFTTVNCPNTHRPEPQAPCEYDQYKCDPQNTNCPACPTVHADCRGKTDGVQPFPGKTWGPDYVECYLNRTISQTQCPRGQFFHPVHKNCTNKVKPTEVKDVCAANPAMVFIDEQNCAKFYNCSDTNSLLGSHHAECHYPDLFSPTSMSCQNFETVACDKRLEPKAPCEYDLNKCSPTNTSCTPCVDRLPSCVNLTDGREPFSGHLWTADYVLCHKDRTVLPTQRCSHGYFHPVTKQCTDIVTPTDAPDYCKANPSDVIPVPDNCAKFINCSAMKAQASDPVQECTYPDLFSTITKQCQDFLTVSCSMRPEPQAPCEYDQNLCPAGNMTCPPCPQRLPSCIGMVDGAHAFTGRLWTQDYIECYKNRTLAIKTCQQGTVFDPIARGCVDTVPRDKMDSYCQANPTTIKPDPENCARYFNCSDNNSIYGHHLEECQYPDLFSAPLLKCVTFDTVDCQKRPEPVAPCDYLQNLCNVTSGGAPCMPCPDRLPSCQGLANGNHSFPGRLWKPEFVTCYKNRTMGTDKCTSGYFHPILEQCTTLVSEPDAKDYCKSNPTAVVAMADNCARSINCPQYVYGMGSSPVQECPYPQLFSTSTMACENFKTVTCDTRKEPQAPCEYTMTMCDPRDPSCSQCPDTYPSCVGLADGNHAFPSRLWKPEYITCDTNRTLLPIKACNPGFFHPIEQTCKDHITTNDSTPYCQSNPQQILSDSTNCARYYDCSQLLRGEPVALVECTYPDLFSTIAMTCQDFTTVSCDTRPEPQAPCEYDQNLCHPVNVSCDPCPRRLPSCVGLPSGDQVAAGYMWTDTYVQCYKNRTMAVKHCPVGAVFDPNQLICVSNVRSGDISQFCQANPLAIKPHPGNCAQYYNCSNPTSPLGPYIEECPYPDLFSTVTQKCEQFENVPCGTRHEPQAPCEYLQNMCNGTNAGCLPCDERFPSCVGEANGDNPDPRHLWQPDYIKCYKNRSLEVKQCGSGFFHPLLRKCTDHVDKGDLASYCPSHPTTILAAEDNCGQFYNCSATNSSLGAYVMECPYPRLFSRFTMSCQSFRTTLCDTRKEPMAPCQYEMNLCPKGNSTCTPCPERLPSCVGLTDGPQPHPVHPWDGVYIMCSMDRTMEVRSCPAGQYFNSRYRRCQSQVDPVDIPDYCRTHPGIIIANSDNCAVYFNCSSPSTQYKVECPYPDLYDITTHSCSKFDTVNCLNRPEPKAPCQYTQNLCAPTQAGCVPCDQRLPSCVGLSDGDHPYPGREFMGDYITCYKDRTTDTKQCATGYFHPQLNACVEKVQTRDIPSYCGAHPSSVLPNPDNCAQYINCSSVRSGVITPDECMYPDLFSPLTTSCQSFTTVDCDVRLEPQAPCAYIQNQCTVGNLTCDPCPVRLPSCVGQTDGPHQFPGREWTSNYIECYKNRTVGLNTCPAGSIFDPYQSACVSRINKNEIQSFCTFNHGAVKENPDNCAQYFNCSQPASPLGPFLVECPYPRLFSSATLTCADFRTVQCGTKLEPQAPCDYLRNLCDPYDSTCKPCSQRLPSCLGLPDGLNPIPGQLWRPDYITCEQNRTVSTHRCATGFFHPQLKTCEGTVTKFDIRDYCQVHPLDILPDPDSCGRYFNCSNPTSTLGPYQGECTYPDLFSTLLRNCVPYMNVDCQHRPVPVSPCQYIQNLCSANDVSCQPCSQRFPSCAGRPEGFNPYPGALWSQDYVVCSHNRTVSVEKCNIGYFNPRTLRCEMVVPTVDIISYCQIHVTAVIPDPGSCAKYFVCSRIVGNTNKGDECLYPNLFSMVTLQCEPFQNVDCGQRHEPKAPCEYDQNRCPVGNITCTSCESRLPSCVGLPDGFNVFGGHLWGTKYLECSNNRTMNVGTCPQHSFFNPTQHKCTDTVDKVDAASFCQSNPTTILPHQTNCAQYYDCAGATFGAAILKECPYPDLFDAISLTCSNYTMVQCGAKYVPKDPCEYQANLCPTGQVSCQPCTQRLPSCSQQTDGFHPYPGSLWQQQYIVCQGSRLQTILRCPGGTVFNPTSLLCVDISRLQTTDYKNYCQANPYAVLPDPFDCSRYYQCSTVNIYGAVASQCIYPNLFSMVTKRCEYFDKVDCDHRREPTNACEYDHLKCNNTASGCIPCIMRFPDCTGLPDGDNGVVGMPWSVNYVVCKGNRTMEVKRCFSGVFDPNIRRCSDTVGPDHINDLCYANPSTVVPHPTNCGQYFDCSRAQSPWGHYLVECDYPLLFDSLTMRCRNFHEVQCGSKTVPMSPCDYLQNICSTNNSMCVPCGKRLVSCVGLPDGNNMVPGQPWSHTYVVCDNQRTLAALTCPSGFFDPSLRQCVESVPPVDIASFCRTNPTAVMADTASCARSINCSAQGYRQECPYPQLFSDTSLSCQPFHTVYCNQRPEPQAPCEYEANQCHPGDITCVPCDQRLPSCRGLPDGINGVSSQLWTDQYVECDQNRTVTVQMCRDGIFDPVSRSCRSFINANNVPDVCSHNPTGRFSDAGDCARYFDCMARPIQQECPYPQLYSTDTHSCQDFRSVACGSRPEPMAPCEYSQNLCPSQPSSCVPCPQRLPSCVRQPDGLNGLPGHLWSATYMQCADNRTMAVSRCPTKQLFDPMQRKCVQYVDSSHIPDFCSYNPTAVVASLNSSAQYYNCSNPSSPLGPPYLGECKYPDLFDPTLLQCRDFEAVPTDSRPVPQAPCQYQQNLCDISIPGCVPCPDRLYSCVGLPDGPNAIEGKAWEPEYVNCYKNRTQGTSHCNQGVFDPHQRHCVVKDNGPVSIADQCHQDPKRMIPHPGSCSLFYNCSKTNPTFGPILPAQLQECTYPDLFSLVYQRCVDFQSVQCDTRHEVKAPCEYLQNHCNPMDATCFSCPERLPSCVGLPDGDNPVIGHYFSAQYIHCFKDRTLDHTNCPNGVFHPYLRKCVDAISPGDVDRFCHENPSSVIAMTENCAKYFDCGRINQASGGQVTPGATIMECQYPDLFSTQSHICMPFTKVSCDQRPEPQAPCEYDRKQQCVSTGCEPCEKRLPSCVGLPDGLNSPMGSPYTDTYIDCHLNRTTDVKHCDKGFFDPGLKTCVTSINSGNIDEYCKSHPRAVLPHPTNCAWFYDCSVIGRTLQSVYPYDVEYTQECPYPKLFSAASMSCENFTQVSCSGLYEPQAPCEYYKNRCDPNLSNCVPCPNRLPSCKALSNGQQVIDNFAGSQRYFVTCLANRTMHYEPCTSGMFACSPAVTTTRPSYILQTFTTPSTTTFNPLATVCAYNQGRVVANPSHCGQYYDCTRRQPPYMIECTYPQLFSEITGRCQDFQTVSCHNRPEYKAPCDYEQNQCGAMDPACTPCPQRLPSCQNLRDGNHSFPGDLTRSRYFTCFLGRTTNVATCPAGIFDVFSRRCAALPSTTARPTSQPGSPQSYCQQHPTEVIPHPNNCAQFYDCHDIYTTSHIVVKECHYPTLFHPILRTCSDYGSVNCGTKYEPQAPCDYYANQCHGGSCIPCPDRFVSCVGQMDGNQPYPGTPSSYVRCQGNRTIAVEICSSGQTFDVVSRQCKAPTGSGDVIRDFCSVNPSAVLTIPNNCAQYYSCRTEFTQLGHYRMECPYPQVFDDVTDQCTDRAQAHCEQRPVPPTECDYELYSCLGFGCRHCNGQFTLAPAHTTHAHPHTPAVTTTPPAAGPSCVGKPDGLNVYPGRNLTEFYIVCDNGQFIEEGICIVDKILDPFRLVCTDPAHPAIIDTYCNANPGRNIPSVYNCAQYHTCGMSQSYNDNPLHECPYPQLYSTTEYVCKWFTGVQCGQKTEPITPCEYSQNQCTRGDFTCVPCEQRLPSCKGLPDGLNPDPLAPNSAKYITCGQGRTVQQSQCDSGVFDPSTRSCNQATVTDPVAAFCASNPNGQMAVAGNCAQYYSCQTEQTLLGHYREECPYPYLYDELGHRCSDRSLVNCGTRTPALTFCDYELYQCIGVDCMRCSSSSRLLKPAARVVGYVPDTRAKRSSASELSISCAGKLDGLYPASEKDLIGVFVECKDQTVLHEWKCPGVSVFSPQTKTCKDPSDPEILDAICSDRTDQIVPSAASCAQFYLCGREDTNHELHECVYPLLYSTQDNKCQAFPEVQCGSRPEPVAPCDYHQHTCDEDDPSCKPCIQRQPSCVGLPDGPNAYPSTSLSTYYVVCNTDRTENIGKCANGLFDARQRRCTSLEEVGAQVMAADVCKDDMAVTYVSSLSASSEMALADKTANYGPERALLNTAEAKDPQGITEMGSWVAEKNNFNQWIQVELRDLALVRGLVTQGRNGCCQDWVTKYRVLYSEDCQTWKTVAGFNVTDAFFQGNTDQDTPVTNMFQCPVMAKCIRVNPLGYKGNIAMRLGLLGCPLGIPSAVTTAAPTTAAPTTPVPTTAAPITAAPTTAAPVTAAPTTSAPVTAAPVTAAPVTAAPVTAAPVPAQTTAAPFNGSPNSNQGSGSMTGVKGCIQSCKGMANGDYPSCAGCTFYATCVWGSMFDSRACPKGLAWDDSIKRCDKKSSTCP